MPVWLVMLDLLALLVAVAVLAVIGLSVRRRVIARGGSTFDLSINARAPKAASARGWVLGIGRYTDTEVEWFRTFSLTWKPMRTFERGGVTVLRRREPEGAEAYALHAGSTVIECELDHGRVQFGLSPEALTGLLAWLESAPPGRSVNNVI